jgi:hypothetical protein
MNELPPFTSAKLSTSRYLLHPLQQWKPPSFLHHSLISCSFTTKSSNHSIFENYVGTPGNPFLEGTQKLPRLVGNLDETMSSIEADTMILCGVEVKAKDPSQDAEVIEYVESESQLQEHAKALARMIEKSRHFVVYTGAGVSTAAKIPDYRGPNGVWTLKDQGKKPEMTISLEQAEPT